MSKLTFTDEEIAEFTASFDRCPTWGRWSRRDGEHGEVLEIAVEGRRPATLRLTKSPVRGYLATGFDGWGLTVCDDFSEMLGILAGFGIEARASDAHSAAA